MTQSNSKRKYRLIIFDVDGTLIPNRLDGMPSPKIKNKFKSASKRIKVSIATSRPLPHVIHILDDLHINSPVIVNGGSQIYDPRKRKFVWEKSISNKNFRKILKFLHEEKLEAMANNGSDDIMVKDLPLSFEPLQMWIGKISIERAKDLKKRFESIEGVIPHLIPSWTVGKIDLIITHSESTKLHGIVQLCKILRVEKQDIIGVGDGYNDFPLLMACGLKVAMGNAVDDLKAIADYVAPTVDEDGVADVIEKFIL